MHIQTFASIDAPADAVFAVLADFAAYDEWNPMCRRMRGRCAVGEKIGFTVKVGPLIVPLTAEVVTVEPGKRLRWVGPALKLARRALSGEHYFELTAQGARRTQLEHGEQVDPPAVFQPDPKSKSKLDPIYVTVSASGRLYLEKENIPDLATLEGRLREIRDAEPERRVVIKGDSSVKYRQVREAFAMCQGLGFAGISLHVSQRGKGGPEES